MLYAVLLLVLADLSTQPEYRSYPAPLFALGALIVVFLARYASTRYVMDPTHLRALRLFGSRTIDFGDVRRIELANLRDLSPTGFWGGWGWRGRSWSPSIHAFDSIHTASPGVLVYADDVPLFLSPMDPVGFARELSRRVRSSSPGVQIGPGI